MRRAIWPQDWERNLRLVVVTPAGREKYLRLLSHFVLGSPLVDEWQLWDNCRNESDRRYLHELAQSDRRCQLKRLPGAEGGWGIIGDFFRFCDDPDALYLRLDDDIVFIEEGFFGKFIERAKAERGGPLWFSPLVINNAICTFLIKYLSRVALDGPITCQAMCPTSWALPELPKALHPVFIEAVRSGRIDLFRVPDKEILLGRYSINAIGFFGADKLALGEAFYAPEQNEEEWLSACLPAIFGRPGKIFGDLVVAHFSFYTQEASLLQTDILEVYYSLAGLPPPNYEKPRIRRRLKDRLRPWRKPKWRPVYSISLDEQAWRSVPHRAREFI